MTPPTDFRIEHLALNVPDPVAMAKWYVQHLAMRVVRTGGGDVHGHFLADASGSVTLEIYRNPKAPVPDYAAQHPLTLHLAFNVDDVRAARDALCAAGAAVCEDYTVADTGDEMAMLRDPWGVPIQLMRRARPML